MFCQKNQVIFSDGHGLVKKFKAAAAKQNNNPPPPKKKKKKQQQLKNKQKTFDTFLCVHSLLKESNKRTLTTEEKQRLRSLPPKIVPWLFHWTISTEAETCHNPTPCPPEQQQQQNEKQTPQNTHTQTNKNNKQRNKKQANSNPTTHTDNSNKQTKKQKTHQKTHNQIVKKEEKKAYYRAVMELDL